MQTKISKTITVPILIASKQAYVSLNIIID